MEVNIFFIYIIQRITKYMPFFVLGDEVSTAKSTDEIDLFEEEQVLVKDLKPNTKYTLQIVAKNKHGETLGKWEDAKTSDPGEYNNFLAITVSS